MRTPQSMLAVSAMRSSDASLSVRYCLVKKMGGEEGESVLTWMRSVMRWPPPMVIPTRTGVDSFITFMERTHGWSSKPRLEGRI